MLDITKDVLSLTDFKRRTSELLERLRETRRPLVLTVNGKAEAVVQSADEYQRLVDEVDNLHAIERIRLGLESANTGRGQSASETFAELEGRHGFLRRK